MIDYSVFRVLVDDPAVEPGLGFDYYATALADVAVTSKPQFAIGIFGGWGSGKTTLMRAIEHRLSDKDDITTVWFNAWRYEREPHLIIPLLDVLHEALDTTAAAQPPEEAGRTARMAAAIARAGKALLAGVTVSAGLAGTGVEVDIGAVLDHLNEDPEDRRPLSFYHAGFVMLKNAIREFSGDGNHRVVIFIDDLDRCMPLNALEVLESMKVFFDLEGFVFIVGLDQSVVERVVATKYTAGPNSDATPITGADYVKKIFQVPFALPRISAAQLDGYLDTTLMSASLPREQYEDFAANIRPQLSYLSGDESVNPREVKRLINAYTMQLKMLGARLVDMDPNVVFALQCMSFRPDWDELYEMMIADPTLFQHELVAARASPDTQNVVWIGNRRIALPPTFVRYIDTQAAGLLTTHNLELYVSAAEAGRTTDPRLLEMHGVLTRLRRATEQVVTALTPERYAEITTMDVSVRIGGVDTLSDGEYRRVATTLEKMAHGQQAPGLNASVSRFGDLVAQYPKVIREPFEQYHRRVEQWAESANLALDEVDRALRDLRRQASVGAQHVS